MSNYILIHLRSKVNVFYPKVEPESLALYFKFFS